MGAEVQSQSLLSEVLDEIRARRSEFEAQKYVPRDMVEKLKKLGIYRAATPKRFGGEQMPPAKFLALIEKISEADGSTGWVASFGWRPGARAVPNWPTSWRTWRRAARSWESRFGPVFWYPPGWSARSPRTRWCSPPEHVLSRHAGR